MRKLGPVETAAAWGLVAAGGLAVSLALLAARYRSDAWSARDVAAAERREKDARLAEMSEQLSAGARRLQDREDACAREENARIATQHALAAVRGFSDAAQAGHARVREELVTIASENPEAPGPWAVLGRFDLETGRPGLARDSLARALALDPNDRASRVLLHVAARDIGESAQAEAVASWFLDSSAPGDPPFGRGLALLAPLSWTDPETGEIAAVAGAAFRAASDASPADPWPRFFLGRLALAEGNLAGAAFLLDEAAARAPDEALLQFWRARAALALGDDLGALVASSIALDRSPLHLGALELRGRVLAGLARTSDAHRDLALAIELAPGRPDLLLAKGEVLARLGRTEEAEADLLATLEIDPRSAPVFLALGRIHAVRGELELASRELARAAELAPPFPEARRERAAILLSLGRKDEALAELDRVLVASPDDVEALTLRGQLLLDLGRASEAAADYEKALRLGASGWRLDEGMGDALAASGRPTAAVLYWRRAAEVSPEAERIREKIRLATKDE